MAQHTPSQALTDRPARVSVGAMREIAQQAQRVQRSIPISLDRGLRGDRGPLGMSYAFPFLPVVTAVVTTAITACGSQTTPVPGSGAAQLWAWDDDTGVTYQNGDDGWASDGIVTVLNWYQASGTIAVGKHVTLVFFGNAWWLLGADC